MSGIFAWLPTAVAVVIFLGAATVYLRGSKDKGTIETLERNNAALTERVTILETSVKEKGDRIEILEREKDVLQSVANSSEEIADLRMALDNHHAQAMAGMTQIHEDLDAIATGLAAAITGGKHE